MKSVPDRAARTTVGRKCVAMSSATPPVRSESTVRPDGLRSLEPECHWCSAVAPARVDGACASVSNPRSASRPRCLELRWVSVSRLPGDGQPRVPTILHVTTRRLCDPTGGGHYKRMYVLLQLDRWPRSAGLAARAAASLREDYGHCCLVPYFPPSILGKFIPGDFQVRGDMATDTRKVILGAVLLAISTVLILGSGAIDIGIPAAAGALAALGLAAGALLVGTSEDGRPV